MAREEGYWISNGTVYYRRKTVKGADVSTFRALNGWWGMDNIRVYVVDRHLRLADVETFTLLNDLFAKDKNCAFYIEGTIKDADAATFEVLDAGSWPAHYGGTEHAGFARDRETVYHYWMNGASKPCRVRGVDRSLFRVLRYNYATDGRRVYWATNWIKGADPETFEVLHPEYGRDRKGVYHACIPVAGADPLTFRILDTRTKIAEDCNHRYRGGEVLPNP
jgi:DKNYY family